MIPTREENLSAMGMIVLNCALVYQLAWIPIIFFLQGANWISGPVAVGVHRFSLVYMIAAPLAYGARIKFRGARRDELVLWLLRCMIPMGVVSVATYAIERAVPSVTGGVIAVMMAAGICVALYGVATRREGLDPGAA